MFKIKNLFFSSILFFFFVLFIFLILLKLEFIKQNKSSVFPKTFFNSKKIKQRIYKNFYVNVNLSSDEQEKIKTILIWLKTNNRLKNIQDLDIRTIPGGKDNANNNIPNVDIDSVKDIEFNDNYADLSNSQKTQLLDLNKLPLYKQKIDEEIQYFKGIINSVLYWLKQDNYLNDIKKLNVTTIFDEKNDDFDISHIQNISDDNYDDLAPEQKRKLLSLSGISDYQTEIKNKIKKTKENKIKNVLKWLKEKNYLKNIKNDEIKSISNEKNNPFTFNIIKNIQNTDAFKTLKINEKNSLLELSLVDDFKNKIIQEKLFFDQLTFLWKEFKNSGFLFKIKSYKLQEVKNINLESFYDVSFSSEYLDLNSKQKDNAARLFRIDNYQNLIKKEISSLQDENQKKTFQIEIILGTFIFIALSLFCFAFYYFIKRKNLSNH